jgi:hypothetical protein
LLGNASASKYVSTETRGCNNIGEDIIYAVRAEMLNAGPYFSLQVGGVSDETVKYGREFCGTPTQE